MVAPEKESRASELKLPWAGVRLAGHLHARRVARLNFRKQPCCVLGRARMVPAIVYPPPVLHFSFFGRPAAIAMALALVAPLEVPSSKAAPVASQVTRFDPVAFFTGSTIGVGQIKKALSTSLPTRVRGQGTLQADGVLVLNQTVDIEGEPTTRRRWMLRQVTPGRFRGSLTDATGPVSAEVAGMVMKVRYTMKGGMGVDQVITLAPDGQSARNRMKIKKFGVTVATLDEIIRRG
jgi:hypothetical protein